MLEVVEAMKYPRVEFASESVKPEGDGYRVAGRARVAAKFGRGVSGR